MSHMKLFTLQPTTIAVVSSVILDGSSNTGVVLTYEKPKKHFLYTVGTAGLRISHDKAWELLECNSILGTTGLYVLSPISDLIADAVKIDQVDVTTKLDRPRTFGPGEVLAITNNSLTGKIKLVVREIGPGAFL